MQKRLSQQFTGNAITLDITVSAARTRSCVTVIESGGQATELVEEALPVEGDEAEAFLARALLACETSRVVVLAGSLPRGLPPETYAHCTRAAHAAGAIVVIDAQGLPLRRALEARPDYVKINREELSNTLDVAIAEGEIGKGAMRLQQMGAGHVIITDGAGKVHMRHADGCSTVLTPPMIPTVNPVGSGDAMCGALALALYRGEAPATALCLATAAGSANAASMIPGEVDAERAGIYLEQLLKQLRTDSDPQ